MADCEGPVRWHHGRDYKVVHDDGRRAFLFLTGNHRVLEISRDLGRRLESGLDSLTASEAHEWSVLAEVGFLDSVHERRLARSTYADGANLALNLNLTGACNLACTYCFADGGDYGRISNNMGSDVTDKIFSFIKSHITKSNTVRFEFFGGEPLLNYPRIVEICRRSDQFAAATGVRFINRISTNLTVLPEGAPELFRDRKFIVSVSIDGGAGTHDRNRPTKSGRGSFDGIIAHCRTVRAVGGDAVTMVARMTVVTSEPPLVENVRELWELDLFDYFQIYPGVTAPGSGCGAHHDGPELIQIGGLKEEPKRTMNPTFLVQLTELLDHYRELFRPGNRFKGVLEYERLAEMVIEGKLALGFCGAGGTYFTFSPDDSIMPCHRLVGNRKMQVGTGTDGLTGDLSEWTLPVDGHPVCSGCWARYACGGNCRQENFVATGHLRVLNEETCNYQLGLVEGVVRLLGRTRGEYGTGDRHQLDDLFVSCGRPVMPNGRGEVSMPPLEHFRPVSPTTSTRSSIGLEVTVGSSTIDTPPESSYGRFNEENP